MKKANFILSFTLSGKPLHSLKFLFCSRMCQIKLAHPDGHIVSLCRPHIWCIFRPQSAHSKSLKKNRKNVRRWQQIQALTRALEQANSGDTFGQRKYVHTVQGRGCRSFSFETDLYWWTWGEETRDREEEAAQSSGSWESLNEHSPEE